MASTRWQHRGVRSRYLSKHIHDLYGLFILKNVTNGILFSKMPQCCAVPMCANKKGGHKFPTKDKSRLKQWLVAIRRDFTPTKNSLVCKSHFTEDDYQLPKDSVLEKPRPVLKKCAVPSRFPWNEENSSLHQKKKERHQRRLARNKKKISVQVHINNEKEKDDTFLMETTNFCEVEIEFEKKQKDIGIQCDLYGSDNLKTFKECPPNENKKKQSSIANVLDITNAAEVQFYTGFQDYEHIKFIFSIFGDEVNCLKYYPQLKTLKVPFLNPCDQFLLVLIKLRRNMLFTELAFRSKIDKTVLSNIFITWINYLYCKLKELNVWVPKQCIDKNMKYYGKINPCTVIVDCTEIKIEKPKNPLTQQLTYSTCKLANTLKVLVGISASGCVTFVSDAYGGSTSDRELFEKCGLIDKLEPNDIILCDRGFNVQDLVCHKNVTVNVPEFLKNTDGQFEPSQLTRSKKISSEQIHVERVIGLAKTFKILSGKLDSKLVPLADRIIFVCFMLTNFKNNIIK
nr:uncharacterized protein LOC126054061 [Helicoverpa armigera]